MFNAWIGYFTPDLSNALSVALGLTICATVIAVIITLVFGPAHLSRTVERNTVQIG
jgi:ABC-type amino acid transport system permease subunit